MNMDDKKPKTWIWLNGVPKVFQDMSLEEQDDFWKDLERKAKDV